MVKYWFTILQNNAGCTQGIKVDRKQISLLTLRAAYNTWGCFEECLKKIKLFRILSRKKLLA